MASKKPMQTSNSSSLSGMAGRLMKAARLLKQPSTLAQLAACPACLPRRSPPAVKAHVLAQPDQPLAEVALHKGLGVVDVGGGVKELARGEVAAPAVLVLVACSRAKGEAEREGFIYHEALFSALPVYQLLASISGL